MKIHCRILIILFIILPIIISQAEEIPTIVKSIRTIESHKTVLVSELKDVTYEEIPSLPLLPSLTIPHDLPLTTDEISILNAPTEMLNQALLTTPTSPPLLSSFVALNDSGVTIPPDTMGAAGTQHLMTTLNDRVRIQTKIGTILKTITLQSFFGTTSFPFDPSVAYDPYNRRWIVVSLIDQASANSKILLAVSQTNDPTETWDIYTLDADPDGLVWADFPRLGFNNKWIVIQVNDYNVSDNDFNRSEVFVFNKADLYANTLGTVTTFPLIGMGGVQTPALTYDNTEPNLYFLQNWNGDSGGLGAIRLYVLSGPIGSEILTSPGLITVASTWANIAPIIDRGFAPQSETIIRIDNHDARMLSVVFRNGSIWGAQTVFLPASSPTHSVAQWWEVTPELAIEQFGRIEDPTATLTTGTFFAYPSIAVNSRNDVVIGYSFFNSSFFASSGYSVHLSTDAPSTTRDMAVLKNGLGIYTKDFSTGIVRWGDYSNTVVDAVGVNFWTIQESADTGNNWTTWWGHVPPLNV